MLRSLFSGITGLRQHQNLMDVVANNIANVNTTGFKSSSVVFEDTLSQLLKAAGSPSPGVGGLNPAQVGLGVQLGSITPNFGQGSAQSTGRSTDLMVQGDGFFIVRNSGETNYTRAGAFAFDTNGRLVNPSGMIVQGWAGVNGVVNTDGQIGDIVIPTGSMIKPVASTSIVIGGNISAGTDTEMTLSATVFDEMGQSHQVSILLIPDGSGTGFDVMLTDQSDAMSTSTPGTLFFAADGTFDLASTDPVLTLGDGTAITIGLATSTMYGGPKSLAVTSSDGASAGSLQQFQIAADGSVLGVFSNGQKLALARIALANFNNPMGLEKIGNTVFQTTSNSRLPQVGTPMSGGRGQLLGATLEMSNVDLAQEFTNLIIAQRGFQANSRVITTSDQMLQDLVDIKR